MVESSRNSYGVKIFLAKVESLLTATSTSICLSREVGYLTSVNIHTDVSCPTVCHARPVLPSSAAGNIVIGSSGSNSSKRISRKSLHIL